MYVCFSNAAAGIAASSSAHKGARLLRQLLLRKNWISYVISDLYWLISAAEENIKNINNMKQKEDTKYV